MTVIASSKPTMSDRARLAAKRAKEEKSNWESYARMMTRNSKTRIEFTSGTPCTDGETIYLRVPIELGDMTPHDKALCGYRDELMIQKCVACRIMEDVRITMYHEVAHVVFDSFAGMSEWEKADVLSQAVRLEAGGDPESKRMKKIQRTLEKRRPGNFIEASMIISPWFKHLINAAEDGRVNERMAESRPGTRVMFMAHINKVFEHGIEKPDGTIHRWTDNPKNLQAIIGIFCKVSGFNYDKWLLPEIVEDLDDSILNGLCQKLATVRGVGGIYRLCIPTLERLRELGYCLSPDDIEDDPEPRPGKPPKGKKVEEEGDDEGDGGMGEPCDDPGEFGDDSDGEGSGSMDDDTEDGDNDAENGDKESTEGDDDDADSDDGDSEGDSAEDGDEGDDDGDLENPEWSGREYTEEDLERDGTPDDVEAGLKKFGGHDKDDATSRKEEEEVARAIRQGDHFDSPSYTIGGVNIHKEGDGPGWAKDHYYSDDRFTGSLEVSSDILQPALMKLRTIFAENKQVRYERNLKSGKINGKVLGQRFATGDPRVFRKKNIPGKRDYFVMIGLDISGSTARSTVLHLIKQSAYAMAEMLNTLGIPFAVEAHTGAGSRHGHHDLEIYEVKSPDAPWDNKAKELLTSLRPVSANLDGHTLEHYRKVVERQQASDKVIFYYTDGAMPLENYSEELEILQREIEVCKRQRIALVGVGIRNDDPKNHGLDTIRLDRIEDIPNLVRELESRLAK